MARTEAFRKYQLTINNPLEHGFSHDVIKTTLGTLKNCLYWCMCDEIGEQGTPHTHVYAAFRNAVEFMTLQQRFYGAHIEGARGSHQENRDYIRKEGKWQDDAKRETNLPDTFEESGDLPEERNAKMKTSEAIVTLIQDGATNAEILRQFPSAMNSLQHINETRQTFLEERFKKVFRIIHTEYIWGQTGVGKTRGILEQFGYDNVHHVTNYAHPFDNYAQQDVILFDEFRSSLPIADMLKYLDGYPLMLPCRYNDRVACFTKVFIVSNIPLEKQYPNIQLDEPATWDAFKRRIADAYEMLPESGDMPF